MKELFLRCEELTLFPALFMLTGPSISNFSSSQRFHSELETMHVTVPGHQAIKKEPQ